MKNKTFTSIAILKRIWSFFDNREKVRFIAIFSLSCVTAFFEIISIAAVIPFLGILSNIEMVFSNPYLYPIIQFLGLKSNFDIALSATTLFCLAALVSCIMRTSLVFFQTRVSFNVGARLSIKIYETTLNQNYDWFIKRNSGDIIANVSQKTNAIVHNAIYPSMIMLSSSIIGLTIISGVLIFNPIIALVVFLSISLGYLIIVIHNRKHLTKLGDTINQETSNVLKSLQEGLGGVRNVILDNSHNFFVSFFAGGQINLRRALADQLIISIWPRFILEAFGMIIIALVGFTIWQNSESLIGGLPTLGVFALAGQRLLPNAQQFFSGWVALKTGIPSIKDAIEVLEDNVDFRNVNGTYNLKSLDKSISLKNTSFYYSDPKKEILKNISITFRKGSKIGIIGETGSGKSTLVDIISGMLSPTSGEIYIDGVVLSPKNFKSWRTQISYVPQSIFLADTSVSENIAFGIPFSSISHERVKKVSSIAKIDRVINDLPKKFETIVGERGMRLSGGQRQRIGLARALYKKSEVLILDEATSALDEKTENEVQGSLNDFSEDLTVIIISHRLGTLKKCDVIYKLSDGKLNPINLKKYLQNKD